MTGALALREKLLTQSNVVRFGEMLPTGHDPKQFLRSVLMAVQAVPKLLDASPDSVMLAAMQAAQLGLTPGGALGECALIPYNREAKLIPMVRGLVTLAVRSEYLIAIRPRLVYKDDYFKVFYGSENPRVEHEPDLSSKHRTEKDLIAVYSVAEIRGSSRLDFEPMTREEVEAVRAVSRAADDPDGPWVKWPGEQWKKTVVKRHTKLMPLSPEYRAAVELDDRFDTGRMNAPTILDSESDVSGMVAEKTRAKAEEMKARMGIKQEAEDAELVCASCGDPVTEPGECADCQAERAALGGQ